MTDFVEKYRAYNAWKATLSDSPEAFEEFLDAQRRLDDFNTVIDLAKECVAGDDYLRLGEEVAELSLRRGYLDE